MPVLALLFFILVPGDSLHTGDIAPDFTLKGATKDSILSVPITLSAFRHSTPVVLAFYPADWSGGCTKEMCTMRDNFVDLSGPGITVFGISGDYVYSHREWAHHLGLQFTLLSDHDHAVARQYNSYDPASGKNRRTVYVIDTSGRIVYVDPAYDAHSSGSFGNLKAALKTAH